MRVSQLSHPTVVTISAEASVLDAAKLMRERHVGDVVVLEPHRRVPRGILTDRDLVVGLLAQGVEALSTIKVGDVVGRELVTVYGEEDALECARKMAIHGVRRMPVLSITGDLIGIIAYDDLVAWLTRTLSELTSLFGRQPARESERRPGSSGPT